MKKVLNGQLILTPFFGAYLVKDKKKENFLKDDLLNTELIDFNGKEVSLIIESKE